MKGFIRRIRYLARRKDYRQRRSDSNSLEGEMFEIRRKSERFQNHRQLDYTMLHFKQKREETRKENLDQRKAQEEDRI